MGYIKLYIIENQIDQSMSSLLTGVLDPRTSSLILNNKIQEIL